jgi:hypothetical protein
MDLPPAQQQQQQGLGLAGLSVTRKILPFIPGPTPESPVQLPPLSPFSPLPQGQGQGQGQGKGQGRFTLRQFNKNNFQDQGQGQGHLNKQKLSKNNFQGHGQELDQC